MHTFGENNTAVPAFLAKLWRLVEDEDTNNLIYWSSDGKSFVIQNQAQFAREILPLNYKHNNMASFIRQLNMYGFHKITSLDGGGLKFDRDDMEFSHPCFQRDNPFLLEHIKRKISTAKTTPTDDKSLLKGEIVTKVLHEVKQVKGRQDSLDSRFVSMKQENEALWREVAILRQKHMKQQQIVNKLIQFLVTIVQPQRGSGISSMGGVKRRFQLMINDVPEASAKARKTARRSSASSSSGGPVIRELTEELLDYNDQDDDISSPYIVSPGGQKSAINEFDEIEDVNDDDISYNDGEMIDENSDLIYEDESNNIADDDAGPSTSVNVATGAAVTTTQSTNLNPAISYVIESIDNNQIVGASGQQPKAVKTQYRLRQQTPVTTATAPAKVKILPAGNARIIPQKAPVVINQVPVATITSGGKSLLVNQGVDKKPRVNMVTQSAKINAPTNTMGKAAQVGKYSVASGSSSAATSIPAATSNNQKKSYTNKDDFISTEMPSDLFGDADQDLQANLDLDLITNETDRLNDAVPLTSGSFGSNTPKAKNEDASSSGLTEKQMALTKYCNSKDETDIMRLNSHDQLNQHLDGVQGDLESIKEYLRNEDYTLDANTLLGNCSDGIFNLSSSYAGENITSTFAKLFGDLDVLPNYNIPMNPDLQTGGDENAAIPSGSELMSYQSSLPPIDFTDFLNIDEPTTNDNEQNDESNINLDTLNSDLSTPYVKQEKFAFPYK